MRGTVARWKISLQADPLGVTSFYLLAALSEMEYNGEVELHTKARRLPNEPGHWIEVEDRETGYSAAVCIDTADSPRLTVPRRAATADVVWKRDYRNDALSEVPAPVAAKVQPFGLWYFCRSGRETPQTIRRFPFFYRGIARFDKAGLVMIRTAFDLRRRFAARGSEVAGLPLRCSDFEAGPAPSAARVVFQTGVWDPNLGADPEDRRRVNDMRADVVRSLKAALGDRFVGGLTPSDHARATYPDCITARAVDPMGYRRLVLGCDIAINTTGLHRSNSFKLAEYYASSRVVLTERLPCELPRPPIEGQEVVSFDDPLGCVNACLTLLADHGRRQSMMEASNRYYHESVRPAVALRLRLVALSPAR